MKKTTSKPTFKPDPKKKSKLAEAKILEKSPINPVLSSKKTKPVVQLPRTQYELFQRLTEIMAEYSVNHPNPAPTEFAAAVTTYLVANSIVAIELES